MPETVDPRGVVPTPPELARRVAARVPRGVPVLDPACGEGALLSPVRGPRLGIELSPAAAAVAGRRLPGASIQVADALEVPWPKGTWVVCNPPWCSYSGRQASRVRHATAGGWPSLHGLFLERVAEHVGREGTGAVLLLPASVLELPRYGPLRSRVTAHASLTGTPVELGEGAFPGVIEPAVLLTLGPRRPGQRATDRPWLTAPTDPLVEALASFPRLPSGTFADPGVHTGNCARELVGPPDAAHLPGLRQGRDLVAFHLGPPSARLNVGLERAEGRRFRVPSLASLQAFPVLLRQTADRPIAALHTEPTYFRNSLLAARDVEGLDPRVVVAVLNSDVLAAWHRGAHRDARQRTFPQVKVGHLAAAPFPLVHRREDPSLHDALAAAYGDGPSVERLVAAAFGVARSRTGS